MTAIATHFALVGRSYPSDAFRDLYSSSLSQRAERRMDRAANQVREARVWRASGEAIVVPARLRA